jgi:predicted ribosomally synthesized peptide with SipW-like signal peptide
MWNQTPEQPLAKATDTRRSDRWAVRIGLTMLVLALLGLVVAIGTWSAFSSTTSNSGNSFSTGTVILSDDDSGSAMLSISGGLPGDSDTGCIQVTYTGTLPATVRLYGTTTGTGLDQYLDLTVTRGTKSDAFDSCADFVPDSTNYIGEGNGVVYDGTLQGYPDNYAAGLVDPVAGSPETWTNPETHAYRFVVTVQDNNNAQGLTATQSFTWEARNS